MNHKQKGRYGGIIVLGIIAAGLLTTFIPAYAVTPVTVATGTGANSLSTTNNRLLCYSNGYYFLAWFDGTNANIASSQTGSSWGASSGFGAPNAISSLSIYCDGSGNIYATWGISTTQFDYRQGTTSGGVVTWAFSAITLTCHNAGNNCGTGPSIYAFDTTHVWIAMQAGTTANEEVWACLTSPCSTVGNWVNKLSDTTSIGYQGSYIIGLSSNANLAVVTLFSGAAMKVRTTSNSGTSWAAAVSTANNYDGNVGSCVSISSTIYCANFDTTSKIVYLATFVQGAGSWTETALQTFGAASAGAVAISTDGTNMAIFYRSSTATTIDFQTSTNAGVTWSGDAVWLSGEATTVQTVTSTPTMQSTSAGVAWELATSNNLRFASSDPLTVTVTATVTAIAVTPCTAFELGCWLYPVFTILMVAIVVIGEARFIQVPKADYTGLFLEASAMGGLICVLFGILNVMVPVIILLMQILRAIAK